MLQQGVPEVQLIGGTGADELRSLCRQIFKSAANLIVSKTLWAQIAHMQLCEPGTSPVPAGLSGWAVDGGSSCVSILC